MPIQALPYVMLVGFLFGSTLIASRFSVGQYAPTTYISLRLLFASLGHVTVYLLLRGRRWPVDRHLWRHAAALGAIGTAIPMTCIVTSMQYQSSGVTSLLLTTGPALTVLLAHFLLPDERLSWRKSIGVALALGGAALLVLQGSSGLADTPASPIGYGLVLLAMVFASLSSIYIRRYMRDMDSFDVASIRMFTAALVVVPLSVLTIGFDLSQVTGAGYGALAWASLVGTFTGMMLAVYLVQRFGATASSMPTYVIPIVAGIGGVLVLGETFSPDMLRGMMIIVAGIAVLNQRGEASTPVPQMQAGEQQAK